MATGHYVVELARGYQTNIQERVVQTGYIQQGNYLDLATYHNDAGQLPAYIQAYQWTQWILSCFYIWKLKALQLTKVQAR